MPPKRKQPAAKDSEAVDSGAAASSAPAEGSRRSTRARKVNYNEDDKPEKEEQAEKPAPKKRARKAAAKPSAEEEAAEPEPEQNGETVEATTEEAKDDQPAGEAVDEKAADVETTKVADSVPEEAAQVAVGTTDDQVADKDDGKIVSDAKVAVGGQLPEVTLKNQDNEDVTVKDLFAEKGGVLFLVPKANTPGCTKQAQGFKEQHEAFTEAGFQVFSISMDTPKVLTGWKSKHELPYHLLSDPKQQLIKALGGSKGAKSVIRSHFVVEKGGKLLLATMDVKAAESAGQVLEFVKAL